MRRVMSDDLLALTPPDAPLVAPEPVAAVPPERAAGRVRLAPEELAKLDGRVGEFIEILTSEDVRGDAFVQRVAAIAKLGDDAVARSAGISSRMLDRPVRAAKGAAIDPKSTVAKGLVDLRAQIEALDPGKRGDLLAPRKLLGMIPMGSKVKAYFDGYVSAQTHLDAIVQTLYRGKDELLRDNAAIESEKAQMWTLMQQIESASYLCDAIDAALVARIATLESADPDRAKILREDVLFPARQKKVDLLTQLAVNVQGYQALDLVKRNNVELMKGVDRATTTTLAALRTAIIVSQALAGQKLVLAQITALSATTGAMIESTSQLLRTQTADIQARAGAATIDVDRLRKAFENVYAAMDDVDAYKARAVVSLEQTAESLRTEIDRAQTRLAPNRSAIARAETQALPRGL